MNADSSASTTGRWIAFVLTLLVLACAFLLAVKDMLPGKTQVQIAGYTAWSEEVVETAKGIAIQDGGRVKPLESYAGYMMLGMRGDRMIKIIDSDDKKVRVSPTAWMLDILFRPEVAVQHPSFRIDNSDVIELIGLKSRAKRDRYSYEELLPAATLLFKHAGDYENLARNKVELDTVQKQTLALARNVRIFELLLAHFSFARSGVELKEMPVGDAAAVQRTSTMLTIVRKVQEEARTHGEPLPERINDLLLQLNQLSEAARFGFAVFPPEEGEKQWLNPGERMARAMSDPSTQSDEAIADIARLEQLVAMQTGDPEAFSTALLEWRDDLIERAEARNDSASVPLELKYNRGQWFFRALFFCFLPGALFVVLSWIAPRSLWGRVMSALVWITSLTGLVLLIIGITQRSVIMQRPPVGNLYDTMPFIAAGSVLLILIVELLTRRKLALAVAPLLGFFGLIMARRYEFGDPSDPMDPLLAVLRSNYWLTIHVLTITLGYVAGLVTAAFAHVYVFLRLFRLDGDNAQLRHMITRITYGCLCFTLLLSLTGTVLGGIWANDSWGRFWGWDPKENGALMIVLWSLFVLHARRGGIIREWGFILWSLFGAIVVTFSWWHVNLLGVGLHSYGFSDSKKLAVFSFYGIETVVLLLGIVLMLTHKATRPATAS